MICEYAIVPDVFDTAGYSSPEVCDLRLSILKDCLLTRGVVRNLWNGGWWRQIEEQSDRWHHRAKELLKKLKQQGRLCDAPACRPVLPQGAHDWCNEAVASHSMTLLHGVVADESTANAFKDNPIVASISRLGQAPWWQGGSNSMELQRTMDDYIRVLGPVLKHSNSLMFVDAHLDPTARQYAEFELLLRSCGTAGSKPFIEIHRSCSVGSGASQRILSEQQCRTMFESPIGPVAQQCGLKVEVFIWDKFHDRCLISNLIGISLPNGFDVDRGKIGHTRWSRLDRVDSDSVQREFHPATQRHELRYRFVL